MVQTEVTIGRLGIDGLPLEGKTESFNIPSNNLDEYYIDAITFNYSKKVYRYLGTPGLDYDLY